MTIQECIKKTVEHLDRVYKDGPHFYITPDTPERQMEELTRTYLHHLDLNLNTLITAYHYGVKDGVTFNKHGWISLPDIPEDKIEVIRATSGKTEVTIKLAEAKGKWLWTYRIDNPTGGYNMGSLCYYGFSKPTRSEAIYAATDAIEKDIRSWEKTENQKDLCNQVRKCIEEIKDNEQQGKLF